MRTIGISRRALVCMALVGALMPGLGGEGFPLSGTGA